VEDVDFKRGELRNLDDKDSREDFRLSIDDSLIASGDAEHEQITDRESTINNESRITTHRSSILVSPARCRPVVSPSPHATISAG
jgi:hypothetical protein